MELTIDQALERGVAAHKAGKVQEADRYYTAILKAQPAHADANHNMGVLGVGVGKVEEALPFFKKALEANPSISQYWLSYIDALIKLNRFDEARNYFDAAKQKGVNGEAWDKLEAQLPHSLFKGHNNTSSHEPVKALIALYSKGDFNEALVQGEVLANQFPNAPNIFNIIGAASAALGRREEAIVSYNKAIELKPDFVEAHSNLGLSLIHI